MKRLVLDLMMAVANPSISWKAAKSLYLRIRTDFTAAVEAYSYDHESKLASTTLRIENILDLIAENHSYYELARHNRFVWIGVSAEKLLSIIRQIGALIPESEVYLNGEGKSHEIRGQMRDLVRRCKYLDVELIDNRNWPFVLRLEPYRPLIDGKWQSRNDRNKILRNIYEEAPFAGVGRRTIRYANNHVSIDSFSNPIDVVYTWVNHEDKNWKKLYKDCKKKKKKASKDAISISRFHNKEELKYSLRSLFKYASWVNNIYIFSNCAPPEWLNLESGNIHWIYHDEVIPSEYLPTFNSHVIESFLHEIPNLCENFIYMNDDFFFTRPAFPSDFFHSSGRSYSFLEEYGTVYGQPNEESQDYLNAARNAACKLGEKFYSVPTRLHLHTGYCLKKSVLKKIMTDYKASFEEFFPNKFRGLNDINLPSFFYHAYALQTGAAQEGKISCALVKNNAPKSLRHLNTPKRLSTICINEGHETSIKGWDKRIVNFMKQYYSVPAEWEF